MMYLFFYMNDDHMNILAFSAVRGTFLLFLFFDSDLNVLFFLSLLSACRRLQTKVT